MPTVSVVIPAYNQADYLPTAVDSVLAQTFTDYEIIIVDDGSTDETAAIAEAYQEDHPGRIRTIHQENQGLAGARNTGIRQARADLIALLDSDDQWLPDFLATMTTLARRHPEATVFYAGWRYMDRHGRDLPEAPHIHVISPDEIYATLLRYNFLNNSTILMRRAAVMDAGLYDIVFRRLQDWEFWLRLQRQGYIFVGMSECLARYRLHGRSLSADPGGGQRAAMALAVKHFGPDDGRWADWPADKRRMFGGVYRYFAITTALQRNADWDACARHLGRALQIDPSLSDDLGLFYELALGAQPLGQRGTAVQLTLSENGRRVGALLDDILSTPELAVVRPRAQGTAYQALGLVAYNIGQFDASRRFFRQAIQARPALLLDRSFLAAALRAAIRKNTKPQPQTDPPSTSTSISSSGSSSPLPLRILFITAFYPPHVIGGWEQLVRDVNERLQARGHASHVLTSTYGVPGPVRETGVSRTLALESDLVHYRAGDLLGHGRRRAQNQAAVRQAIEQFRPDVVFVHVMFNLSWAIPWQAEQMMPGRVIYYVANDWPHAPDPHTAFWRDPATNSLLNLGKRLLAPLPLWRHGRERERFALQFEHVLCVSEAVRHDLAANAGVDPAAMRVVYNGVETDRFAPNGRVPGSDGLKLLYAGSIVEHKGVHTAVEAMAHLAESGDLGDTTLDVVGSGHPDYEAHLRRLVAGAGLGGRVHFRGRVPREQMPAVLQGADVLLMPSIWEEPLSRMMQEGMAAGLAVVGTLTGGSGELLVEEETGLTFPAGDAEALAGRIRRLQVDRTLLEHLAQNARAAVVARFDIERMINEVEAYLGNVAHEDPTP